MARTPLRPNLPQGLLDDLNSNPTNTRPNSRGSNVRRGPSRKQARQQGRLEKKKRKAAFFSGPPSARPTPSIPTSHKRQDEAEHGDSPKYKKAKPNTSEETRAATSASAYVKSSATPTSTSLKERGKLKVTGRNSKDLPSTRLPRSHRDIEDDRYIQYLESQLGYQAGQRSKKVTEDDDGLDDLLDFTSKLTSVYENPDESEELAGREAFSSSSVVSDEDQSGAEAEADLEEWGGISDSPSDEADSVNGDTVKQHESDAHTADDPPVNTRYVPPHLRNKAHDDDSEELVKLKRHLKGLLNKMSEQNMATVVDGVEEFYRSNRRYDVSSTLTTLIIDGISSHSSLLDSYVVLHAALVSGLHKFIGIEFAAHFVQQTVATYERYHTSVELSNAIEITETATAEEENEIGKECSNLIVLISELYNFQVISCVLVYDIVRELLQGTVLKEFDVELLLKIVRNSGQQLRQDDPSALKDIIGLVQAKAAAQDEGFLSSRARFMIETLTNLKNNKSKRNQTQNQGAESVDRLKKFLAGQSKKRHVLANEPLRATLEDLRAAESKGKWWLVGAAWGGDPLVDRMDNVVPSAQPKENSINDNALLKLAKKQGMNTDVRRSIFVVLMGSDDFVDACERLAQLNLKEVQQREIVRVLLHCCGNERAYNPFYVLVCQHLCSMSHSYKITLQFCLWDFLRDLGETNVGGADMIKNRREDEVQSFDVQHISSTRLQNLAKAYGWWIAKDCVNLTILKPIDFTSLKPQTKVFLKHLCMAIFISSHAASPLAQLSGMDGASRDRSAVQAIFTKATRLESLTMGLAYFMNDAFKVTPTQDVVDPFVEWVTEVAKNTLGGALYDVL